MYDIDLEPTSTYVCTFGQYLRDYDIINYYQLLIRARYNKYQ